VPYILYNRPGPCGFPKRNRLRSCEPSTWARSPQTKTEPDIRTRAFRGRSTLRLRMFSSRGYSLPTASTSARRNVPAKSGLPNKVSRVDVRPPKAAFLLSHASPTPLRQGSRDSLRENILLPLTLDP